MSNGNGHHWSKFVWRDWQRDTALQMCSLAAQGLWVRMLCLMHDADGYLMVNDRPFPEDKLHAIAGCKRAECKKLLAELERNHVFSRTENGVIFSRRMVRDVAMDKGWKETGARGGNPHIRRGTVPKEDRVRPFKRSDAPQKTARILAKTGGKCHWCGVLLQSDLPAANFFHVDHVVAVCDGGTNDESNLVPACAVCNHDRARQSDPNTVSVGAQSDTNPPAQSDSNHYRFPTPTLESERKNQSPPRSPPKGARSDRRKSARNGFGPLAKPPENPPEPPTIDGVVEPIDAWITQFRRRIADG